MVRLNERDKRYIKRLIWGEIRSVGIWYCIIIFAGIMGLGSINPLDVYFYILGRYGYPFALFLFVTPFLLPFLLEER
ncbi:MAG: hypothetical protein J7L50_01415 [Candidatus Odinarchaeota archaeon]|nr:hypothetical protein [Candidatus Odinarchaeota archaeon]